MNLETALKRYKSARRSNNRLVYSSGICVAILCATLFFLSPPPIDFFAPLVLCILWVVFLNRFTPDLASLRKDVAKAKFERIENELSEEEKEELVNLLFE